MRAIIELKYNAKGKPKIQYDTCVFYLSHYSVMGILLIQITEFGIPIDSFWIYR